MDRAVLLGRGASMVAADEDKRAGSIPYDGAGAQRGIPMVRSEGFMVGHGAREA